MSFGRDTVQPVPPSASLWRYTELVWRRRVVLAAVCLNGGDLSTDPISNPFQLQLNCSPVLWQWGSGIHAVTSSYSTQPGSMASTGGHPQSGLSVHLPSTGWAGLPRVESVSQASVAGHWGRESARLAGALFPWRSGWSGRASQAPSTWPSCLVQYLAPAALWLLD